MPTVGNRTHPLRPARRSWADTYLGTRLSTPQLVERLEPAPPGVRVGVRAQPDPDPVSRRDQVRLRLHSNDAIDRIARDVAQLGHSLSLAQRRRLRIIAKELTRRAKPGRAVTPTEQEDD